VQVCVACTTWCKPCKLLKPLLEAICGVVTGVRLLVFDPEAENAFLNGVRSFPTTFFYSVGARQRFSSSMDMAAEPVVGFDVTAVMRGLLATYRATFGDLATLTLCPDGETPRTRSRLTMRVWGGPSERAMAEVLAPLLTASTEVLFTPVHPRDVSCVVLTGTGMGTDQIETLDTSWGGTLLALKEAYELVYK